MSSVRPITSKIIVTNIYKEEFDRARENLYSSKSLSNGQVAFFYSSDIPYFDILDPVTKTVVRIEIKAENGWEKRPQSAFLVEDRWLLVVVDFGSYLILDKQKNYKITHQGRSEEFSKYKNVHFYFLRNLLPLGGSRFTAVADQHPQDRDHNFVLCEVNESGVKILHTLEIPFPEMMWREGYSVLSPTEIALVLVKSEGEKQFYLLKVEENKLIQSKPIDFELKTSDSMLIKKITDHTVVIFNYSFRSKDLIKCNLDLKEAKQLPGCDSIPITYEINSIGFIPNSNFILLKEKTFLLYDFINNVTHTTQLDATDISRFTCLQILDNGQIFVMQENGTVRLFRLRKTEEILNLLYPMQEPQNDAILLPMVLGKMIVDYAYGFLEEVPTPRSELEHAPVVLPGSLVESKRESKRSSPLAAQSVLHKSMPLQVSSLMSRNAESGNKYHAENKEDKKPEVFASVPPLAAQVAQEIASPDIWGDQPSDDGYDSDDDNDEDKDSHAINEERKNEEPEINCTGDQLNQAKNAAKMLMDGYEAWWKLSFFGHHHNDRAIAISEAVSKHPTEAKKIIEHQIKLFNGDYIDYIPPEVLPRWRTLRNRPADVNKSGFYKILLKMQEELNRATPTQTVKEENTDKEENTCRCLPW